MFASIRQYSPDEDIWSCIARHKQTLKRLSVHSWIWSDNDKLSRRQYDIGPDFELNAQNPAHPLAGLNLDCLGLSCSPHCFVSRGAKSPINHAGNKLG